MDRTVRLLQRAAAAADRLLQPASAAVDRVPTWFRQKANRALRIRKSLDWELRLIGVTALLLGVRCVFVLLALVFTPALHQLPKDPQQLSEFLGFELAIVLASGIGLFQCRSIWRTVKLAQATGIGHGAIAVAPAVYKTTASWIGLPIIAIITAVVTPSGAEWPASMLGIMGLILGAAVVSGTWFAVDARQEARLCQQHNNHR